MHTAVEPRTAKTDNIWSPRRQSKFQRWQSFNLDDKIKVVYEVVVSKAKVADVAKKYHRTASYISKLIKKVRSNNELLRELIQKQE